jgi:threonylcarbamoyladenosine tRNA methylthiotransferase MtaB
METFPADPTEPDPILRTFGCRLNIAESETMRDLACSNGLDGTVIVNTCAVTEEAERQAVQAIRRAHRERPEATIIVTGCAATLDNARFAGLPGVSHVLENRVKLDPLRWAEIGRFQGIHRAARSATVPPHTRAFVPIQQGCDHRCTFCVIPYARGPSRSMPATDIIAAVARAIDAGQQEIVLTGVDLTAWGRDLPGNPSLGMLVGQILAAAPALPRLRLSSLDSAEIDEAFWDILAREPRLMPHLHLSIQSGDDLVLKQMRRRHSRAQVIATARRARAVRPDIALGADFIVGFPTETEPQFERTLDLVEEAELDYLHVFAFSARPLTPAAKLPPLPAHVVQARSARLRALASRRLRSRLGRLVGRQTAVLMERGGAGHTACFARARPTTPVAPGTLVRLRIERAAEDHVVGDVV